MLCCYLFYHYEGFRIVIAKFLQNITLLSEHDEIILLLFNDMPSIDIYNFKKVIPLYLNCILLLKILRKVLDVSPISSCRVTNVQNNEKKIKIKRYLLAHLQWFFYSLTKNLTGSGEWSGGQGGYQGGKRDTKGVKGVRGYQVVSASRGVPSFKGNVVDECLGYHFGNPEFL